MSTVAPAAPVVAAPVNGVTIEGQQPAPPPAAPVTPEPAMAEDGMDVPGPWNWLQIAAGVVIVTGFFLTLHYYRKKVVEINPQIEELKTETAALRSQMNKDQLQSSSF